MVVEQSASNDRQSYLRHCSGSRFRNFLFHSVSNCLAVRRKLERGGQTTQGHCASIEFGLAINRGRLYSASGYYVFGYPAQLGGRVSRSGDVRANAVAGPRTALGTGRLRRFQGNGT